MRKTDDFVIIRMQGKQYIVSDGDDLTVQKLRDPKDVKYDVLLSSKAGKVSIGKPTLTDVKLDMKVKVDSFKGEKVHVFKYKSKSRYRKRMGFRPQFSKLEVKKVN